MGWPKDKFNPLQFFLGYLFDNVSLYWFHEFFHWVSVTMFGGQAVVRAAFGLLPVFITDISVWPLELWKQVIVTLLGGWGVAAYCWFKWSQTTDIENRIIYNALGWAQFFEGSIEGISWMLGIYSHPQVIQLRVIAILGATLIALARSKRMWTG